MHFSVDYKTDEKVVYKHTSEQNFRQIFELTVIAIHFLNLMRWTKMLFLYLPSLYQLQLRISYIPSENQSGLNVYFSLSMISGAI